MVLEERTKTAAIFFDIEKAYNKINRNKTFELQNVEIQRRIIEFIRELISDKWIKERASRSTSQSKQTWEFHRGNTKCDSLPSGN